MIPKPAFVKADKRITIRGSEDKLQLLPYEPVKWRRYFGFQRENKLKRLLMTNVGAYSIARPRFGARRVHQIFDRYPLPECGNYRNTWWTRRIYGTISARI